ncbi:MAG: D-alanyl-D-alanine carboxypeptidase/D-alanyl-D-alanine-endopeptidase [Myxococcales bacterium]|nr:D-alanyl-D-alanine carboxypeptidase/D-alanyl-D-alanine-endopeptidase [Myxococcales bacterium]
MKTVMNNHPTYSLRVVLVLLMLGIVLTGPGRLSAQPPKALVSRLTTAVTKADTIAEKWGVAVIALDSGDVVFAAGTDEPLNLASNGKLPTTAAALEHYGPDTVFETVIKGNMDGNGAIDGDLIVVGGGDPSMTVETLRNLVQKTQAAGVTEISGRVCVDDSLFDSEHLPPAFDQKSTGSAYRASVGAFAVDYSAFSVGFRPGAILGTPARVTISPGGSNVVVENRSQTITGKVEKLLIESHIDQDRTVVTVTGTIGIKNKGGAVRRRIDDPALQAAGVFRQLLQNAGVEVANDGFCRAKATADMETLVVHTSPKLAKLVADVNLHSNNMMAETLLKLVAARTGGTPARWSAGQEAVAKLLENAGLQPGSFQYLNGSGLYDADFVSALDMALFLRWVFGQTYGKTFVDSLPVAGKSGTLRGRMGGTPAALRVMAKTGTLDAVITLSGYVQAQSGRWYTFAFLFNGTKTPHGIPRGLQDRLCAIVAEFG